MDANPVFLYMNKHEDICLYLLKIQNNITLPSELATSGYVSWKNFHVETNGMVYNLYMYIIFLVYCI